MLPDWFDAEVDLTGCGFPCFCPFLLFEFDFFLRLGLKLQTLPFACLPSTFSCLVDL